MNRQFLITLGAICLLFVGILAGFQLRNRAGADAGSTAGGSYFANLEKFERVVQFVNENYFEKVNNEKLVEDAIRGMLDGLDPHTYYISAAAMKEMSEEMQGSFDGIGVEFGIMEDTIRVVAPLRGGPSERLGILAGDRIVKIDDKVVAGIGITSNDVFKYLKGPRGSKVRVTIKRIGVKDPMEFEIVRDKIPVRSIDYAYMVNSETGYIRVARFAQQTFKEFRESLKMLKAKGMKNLILDLRNNPGGLMSASIQISDDFLGNGKLVVYTEGRIPQSNERFEASDFYKEWEQGGLVVMVDEGSASASEIVAGAVQDWDRGLIVGTRSFGKGLVQNQVELGDGSAVRIVVSRYFTPAGRCIQKPFAKGKGNEYEREVYARFESGEAYDPTKVKFPDSLRYKTNSGRTVYGGGAILPDVFVADDTTGNTQYLYNLLVRGVFDRFAYKYVDSHPELKTQYKDGFDFTARYQVSDALLKELTTFAAENKVAYVEKDFQRSRRLIQTWLKARIGHGFFGDDATTPVFLSVDRQFQAALKLIPAARQLESTGSFDTKLVETVEGARSTSALVNK